jgi:hypothetical protein
MARANGSRSCSNQADDIRTASCIIKAESTKSLGHLFPTSTSLNGNRGPANQLMPLLDHFHSPLDERYPWESFHSGWATRIADQLSDRLPAEFVVAEHTHSGNHLEIDVATFEQCSAPGPREMGGAAVGVVAAATLATAWAPPEPLHVVPAIFPDVFEVQVFSTCSGFTLVGAIELISPGNKDRTDARRAFTTKCAAYLHQGVCVIIVDIVTNRRANLHNELVRSLVPAQPPDMPGDPSLYAIAYRPVLRRDRPQIEIWPATLAVGDPLPTLPLRLTGDMFVPVDFEAAYLEACRRRRLA